MRYPLLGVTVNTTVDPLNTTSLVGEMLPPSAGVTEPVMRKNSCAGAKLAIPIIRIEQTITQRQDNPYLILVFLSIIALILRTGFQPALE